MVSSNSSLAVGSVSSNQASIAAQPPTPKEGLFEAIFKRVESWIAPNTKPSVRTPKDPGKYIKHQEQSMLEPVDRVVKTAARDILGRAGGVIASENEHIIDFASLDDMNVFRGTGTPEACLANKIPVSTELGKMYLMGLLACPTADVPTLLGRQDLIRGLNSSCLADEISKALSSPKIRDGEKQLLSFWNPKAEFPQTFIKQFYRFNEKIASVANESPLALEAGIIYAHAKKALSLGFSFISQVAFPVYAANLVACIKPVQALAPLTERLISTKGIAFALASYIPSPWTKAVAALVAAGMAYTQAKEQLAWLKVDFIMDQILQKKFLGVASYYRAVKEVYTELSKHPELTQHLSHFKKLEAFFHDKSLSALFNVLESRTFSGEAGWLFFRRGNPLFLLNQFTEPKVLEKFEQALTAIAEIDSFVSAAKMVDEFKDKRVKFCFPKYLEGRKGPELHIDDFWNMFVNPEKVVVNSVHFGGSSQVRFHIITGPNGGGKTTILRAVAEGITVFGQSLGIAPASSFSFTPFKFAASSMSVVDVQGEKSHLEAECDRNVAIQKRIEALGSRDLGFVVLDEPFSGASSAKSSALSTTYMESLGRAPNVLGMVATHDDTLPDLERSNPQSFKNYQVLVSEDAMPLFQLKVGISDRNIAFEVALRRGISKDQIQRAQEFFEGHKVAVPVAERSSPIS